MDALGVLMQQHRDVEELFAAFEAAEDDEERTGVFEEIADGLAVHASIEERFFYPAVRARQTEEELEEAFDEHLEIKRLLLDAMRSTDEPGFDAKVAALKGAVSHHVEEEEEELFPKVKELLGGDLLEAIGQQLELEAEEMKSHGAARYGVEAEIEAPASP